MLLQDSFVEFLYYFFFAGAFFVAVFFAAGFFAAGFFAAGFFAAGFFAAGFFAAGFFAAGFFAVAIFFAFLYDCGVFFTPSQKNFLQLYKYTYNNLRINNTTRVSNFKSFLAFF